MIMTTNRFLRNPLFATAFFCCLFSCTTTKLSLEEAQRLQSMSAPNEMALVYFVRPNKFAPTQRMRITCDGAKIGSTQGKQYIYTIVKPGKHDFVSKAENKAMLSIVAEAGKIYFIEQVPKPGILKARNELEGLVEEVGREKLAKC